MSCKEIIWKFFVTYTLYIVKKYYPRKIISSIFCVAKKSKLFYFYSEMNDFIEIVKEKELEFYNPETIFIFLKIFIL